MPLFSNGRENSLFAAALSLVCLALFIFLGVKTIESIQTARFIDEPTPMERTIYVEGIGKATMAPDIAVMTFGISSTSKTVAEAQKQNSALMNALIEKIKATGVAQEDSQTKDYSAYEKTEWNAQTQRSESGGWIVSQSLAVKIRDVQKISTIVEIAGQNGSTSISGPTFTVDDQSSYESTARQSALADAKKKAQDVADSLGLRIDRVIGYSEYKEDMGSPISYMEKGMGGATNMAAPSIQTGTQEIRLHATITFLLER